MVFAGLITMPTSSCFAESSEFIADFVIKGEMISDSGKLWVKGHKARQEMGAQADKMIMIIDLDQRFQTIFSWFHRISRKYKNRRYLKYPLKISDPVDLSSFI